MMYHVHESVFKDPDRSMKLFETLCWTSTVWVQTHVTAALVPQDETEKYDRMRPVVQPNARVPSIGTEFMFKGTEQLIKHLTFSNFILFASFC